MTNTHKTEYAKTLKYYQNIIEKNSTNNDQLKKIASDILESFSEQNELLKIVFNSSPYISLIVNNNGNVKWINRAGINFSEIESEKILNLLGGEVFGCINASHGNGCGQNYECKDCPIRSRVEYTFSSGNPIFSAEGHMIFKRNSQMINMDIQISTIPVNLNNQNMGFSNNNGCY